MLEINCNYNISKDFLFLMDADNISILELSQKMNISRTALDEIVKTNIASPEQYEKIYSYAYENHYRINSVKEELSKEKYHHVLFHGSKEGLSIITNNGSREKCDFGNGFYLGETYNQALSFICDKENSSIYSFEYSLDNLKVKRFECNMEWMLAICHYRQTLQEYKNNEIVKKIVSEVEDADVVIAPIADNRMFFVMSQFTDGEINADIALHSLSAYNLGLQYIFKTDKAINQLTPLEKYYICNDERKASKAKLIERSFEIDTKLKLAKREFKNGLYIEEILK